MVPLWILSLFPLSPNPSFSCTGSTYTGSTANHGPAKIAELLWTTCGTSPFFLIGSMIFPKLVAVGSHEFDKKHQLGQYFFMNMVDLQFMR